MRVRFFERGGILLPIPKHMLVPAERVDDGRWFLVERGRMFDGENDVPDEAIGAEVDGYVVGWTWTGRGIYVLTSSQAVASLSS